MYTICYASVSDCCRLSQDLAKDLAMLAQEIHDVAGEADSGMGTTTSPGSVPNTPASTISAREEVEHHRVPTINALLLYLQ